MRVAGILAALAATCTAGLLASGALVGSASGVDSSAEASGLIDDGVAQLKLTSITYQQWLKRDYPPGVREQTAWGRAFAAFEAAKRALVPPQPPTTTAPPPTTTTAPPTTTGHPPPPTTTEPPPTTTAPPPPPPPSSGYPDASNTGVINEAALSLQANPGQVTYITKDGSLIENTIFNRAVIVMANNVTFRNVRWKFSTDFYMLRVEEQFGDVLVEDSEFDGLGSASINAAVAGPGWTLRRVEIQGVQDGAKLSRDTHVYDSWIHDLQTTLADPHYDALQNIGGRNNVIRHNTLDVGVGPGRNAAIMLREYYGKVDDILVEDNRLLGGGWTFACCSEEGFGLPSNIRLINNRFGPFAYGPVAAGGNDQVLIRSGNFWDVTATAGVPGEPIPGG
jgi:hypothetical protein